METQKVNLNINNIELNDNEATSSHKYWAEEFRKCTDSWYFYVNYCAFPDGTKPTISREEYYARLNSKK